MQIPDQPSGTHHRHHTDTSVSSHACPHTLPGRAGSSTGTNRNGGQRDKGRILNEWTITNKCTGSTQSEPGTICRKTEHQTHSHAPHARSSIATTTTGRHKPRGRLANEWTITTTCTGVTRSDRGFICRKAEDHPQDQPSRVRSSTGRTRTGHEKAKGRNPNIWRTRAMCTGSTHIEPGIICRKAEHQTQRPDSQPPSDPPNPGKMGC